ncbi:MAG: 3-octaprenyl-4-hydroxybenzoate carboxy-lyase, partial [Candidatus Omnitrophica bacterium]|nr:3-octaprenyl-4-hydroxybenzoate carboxy-lyase [Candidatus Omnitrophota bacterium]
MNEVRSFVGYMLEHADFTRDLHFLTRTNMDTLDYSGGRLNSGSKLIVAASSKSVQPLSDVIPAEDRLPAGLSRPRLVSEGIAAFEATAFPGTEEA